MKNYLTKDKYPVQNHPTAWERDIVSNHQKMHWLRLSVQTGQCMP